MDELTARAVLVPAPDLREGIATSVPRSEIEDVLAQSELPIELVLDVTRFSDGEAAETRSVAVSWEREELERLLQEAKGDEVILTFDRDALYQAVESDVEAHGLREKALILAVAATAATGAGAAVASAEPGAFLGAEAQIAQTGTSPDDRAFARGPAVPTPEQSPDDRAVPRTDPAAAPTQAGPEIPYLSQGQGVTPADLGIGTGTAPDDRAVPRGAPVEAPIAGTASDPGITWAPSPAETAGIAGAIALMITGAFFVVGGRRRMRPGAA
jgi:hypothetical protein